MHFVIKLSKLCNLRCTYCYEYDELGNKERMSLENLEFFFKHLGPYLAEQTLTSPVRFVLHGGEPLLLPHHYLRAFRDLQRRYLDPMGLTYQNVLQTNLVKVSDRTLDLLQELDIRLGVSLDVFGDQRVDITGKPSQDRVLENLQHLIDRQIPFGAIAVLHALNLDRAVDTYHFYNQLGIDCRLLPIFSLADPPARMQHLMLNFDQVLETFQAVATAQFSAPTNIKVYPLWQYFQAAARYLAGETIRQYDPVREEWALIVNTNGDVYSHGDSYLPQGWMGNVFKQPIGEILASEAYIRVAVLRLVRSQTCRRCPFDRKCNQLPMAEAMPSERAYDAVGDLQCPIARPMIEFMVDKIQHSPAANWLINSYANAPSVPAAPVL